jgi:CRP-like cAMP-binding protein
MQFLFGDRPHPRARQLKNVVLFKDLSNRELTILSGMMHERHYLAGEVIFDEGEDGQGLFIVLSGRVRIARHVARDKERAKGLDFGVGSFFGEIALLDESPRTAQARAAEDTQIVALFRAEFISLLQTHSSIASRVSFSILQPMARSSGSASSSPRV